MKLFKSATGLLTGLFLTVLSGRLAFIVLETICQAKHYSGLTLYSLFSIIVFLIVFAGLAPRRKGTLTIGISQAGSRMMFTNAKALVNSITDSNGRRLYNADMAVCTQSFLRGQAPLSTGASTYNIPMLKNQTDQTATRVTQQLLALQDIFVTFQIGVFMSIGNATNTAIIPYTYGNAIAFSTSGAAAALWTIYNGQIRLLNNNQQVVPAFDMMRFYKAPAIQAITDIYYDGTAVQQDQKDMFEDVFTPIEPGWVINGAGNMVMSVVCPGAPAVVQTDSCLDFWQRGTLLQNVTPVN